MCIYTICISILHLYPEGGTTSCIACPVPDVRVGQSAHLVTYLNPRTTVHFSWPLQCLQVEPGGTIPDGIQKQAEQLVLVAVKEVHGAFWCEEVSRTVCRVKGAAQKLQLEGKLQFLVSKERKGIYFIIIPTCCRQSSIAQGIGLSNLNTHCCSMKTRWDHICISIA